MNVSQPINMYGCYNCNHHNICKYEDTLWDLHRASIVKNPEEICNAFNINNKSEQTTCAQQNGVDRLERVAIPREEEKDECQQFMESMHNGTCSCCHRENVPVKACRACGKEVCLRCGELTDTFNFDTGKTEAGFFCADCNDY